MRRRLLSPEEAKVYRYKEGSVVFHHGAIVFSATIGWLEGLKYVVDKHPYMAKSQAFFPALIYDQTQIMKYARAKGVHRYDVITAASRGNLRALLLMWRWNAVRQHINSAGQSARTRSCYLLCRLVANEAFRKSSQNYTAEQLMLQGACWGKIGLMKLARKKG